MTTVGDVPAPAARVLADLAGLVEALRADDRIVVGPTVRDGAIVLAELASAAELPYGWGVELDAGHYRLRPVDQRLAFANSAGPQSWKAQLHPPRQLLMSARRTPDDGFVVDDTPPAPSRLAFLGVRPCDLRAIGILDQVLGSGRRYAERRADVLIIAVNCTEPGAACFCVSAGGGPAAEAGHDLVLTERADGRLLAEAGTTAGGGLLARLPGQEATAGDLAEGRDTVGAAANRMGRTLPPGDLRALLVDQVDSAHWNEVANRCLTCGNCTMVCPTCFCTTVSDTTDVTGEHAQRWEHWDSCFDRDFSFLHGGPVRPGGASRYRQWLSHKLGTWHDQFGQSGCVGCGRCVVWCPVGIDLTAELAALTATSRSGSTDPEVSDAGND